jgi:hypothetical protein
MEGDVIVFPGVIEIVEGGVTTLRLTEARDGPPPPAIAPRAAQWAAPIGPKVDDTCPRPGQRYYWAAHDDVQMVWTIVEIDGARVWYTSQAWMETDHGPQPVGVPSPRIEFDRAMPTSSPPDPEPHRARLQLGAAGVFDCLITSVGDETRCTAMQGNAPLFPGCVAIARGHVQVRELVGVTGPPPETGAGAVDPLPRSEAPR